VGQTIVIYVDVVFNFASQKLSRIGQCCTKLLKTFKLCYITYVFWGHSVVILLILLLLLSAAWSSLERDTWWGPVEPEWERIIWSRIGRSETHRRLETVHAVHTRCHDYFFCNI